MHEYSAIIWYFALIYTNGILLNFLAHQYLSFEESPIRVGNFIADTLRGTKHEFNRGVDLGIEIHRRIDTFTDTHDIVLETRKLLYPYFRKYAGVVQDVFYDHFLAKAWDEYHTENLAEYCTTVYATLNSQKEIMNPMALRILHYMELQNWLFNYSTIDGIDRALKGLSRRAKFDSKMEESIPALLANYQEMEAHFKSFFPSLQKDISDKFSQRVADLKDKSDM